MLENIRVTILRRTGRPLLYMQYRDPDTGRKVMKSTGTANHKKALRKAAEWENQVREGKDKRHGRMSWAEFRQRYEDEVLAGLAVATDQKVSTVFNMLERITPPPRLMDLTADRLNTFQKGLRDMGRSENTIKGHLAHIRAALAWAVGLGLLRELPKIPKVQRAKGTRVMKGRPITGEEFERMLAKVEAALVSANQASAGKQTRKSDRRWSDDAQKAYQARVGEAAANVAHTWKHLLRGLWWSGLRLEESLELHWTDETKLRIDLSCQHPMLRIPAELEKGHKDRLLPLSPEFAEFLMQTPPEKRTGYVFNPRPVRADKVGERLGEQQVGRVLSATGIAAGVKVNTDQKSGKVKFASAHDLRRSFGDRWAVRVMPQVLMELMRHESIETTLRYYVGRNAQATAATLWSAYKATGESEFAKMGDTLGDSDQGSQETANPRSSVNHCEG